MKISDLIQETATCGATSAGSIAPNLQVLGKIQKRSIGIGFDPDGDRGIYEKKPVNETFFDAYRNKYDDIVEILKNPSKSDLKEIMRINKSYYENAKNGLNMITEDNIAIRALLVNDYVLCWGGTTLHDDVKKHYNLSKDALEVNLYCEDNYNKFFITPSLSSISLKRIEDTVAKIPYFSDKNYIIN